MITALHHVALICSAEEPSVKFYEALGFREVDRQVRATHEDTIIWMKGHGITLELFIDPTHPPRVSDPEANGLRHLALHTDDVMMECERLRQLGYKPEFVRKTPGGKLSFVKDPDGTPIELHE